MPLLGCPKFVVTLCMRCGAFDCIAFEWSLVLLLSMYFDDVPTPPLLLPPPPAPPPLAGSFECWLAFDVSEVDWLGDCCCCDCDADGAVDGSCSAVDGSYLRGRPRDKWRRFTNSLSSTIQNEPKSSSYRTKHLCSDKFVRIAFYELIQCGFGFCIICVCGCCCCYFIIHLNLLNHLLLSHHWSLDC